MSTHPLPLVVDLDGTLTPTDTLVEGLARYLRAKPLAFLSLLRALLSGRAAVKAFVAGRVPFDAGSLPYREDLLRYLHEQAAAGRRIVLATAAHRDVAAAVSSHLGLFESVLASDASRNLKGREKLAAIQAAVGEDFVYAGDSAADLEVWMRARGAVLVGVSPRVAALVHKHVPVEQEFPQPADRLRAWARAVRPHQSLKNLLVFVPLLTSFSYLDLKKVLATLGAFAAFSLTASATYLLNDILDVDSDRQHPRKRLRPFASGQLTPAAGLLAAALLFSLGMLAASRISLPFLVALLAYIAATNAYSLKLKTYVLVDVLALALLYTLRIFAGAVAIEVEISSWLLSFSVFLFFGVAMVKRCAELVSLQQLGQAEAAGRDYRTSDLAVLWPLGVGSSMCAAVVFGLYIQAPETQQRYATPELLWLVGVGLLYWLGRLWIKTSRGQMHDDPLVFALRDRGSRATVALMMVLTILAKTCSF